MVRPSAKRLIALVATRYGADRARVRQALRGAGSDPFDALVVHGLLTSSQAEELRLDLLPKPLGPEPRSLAGCRILRRLGEGGMGAVYLGYDEAHRQPVAIKVLAADLSDNPVCVSCFQRESRTGLLLDHPHLVRGIGAGRDEASGMYYLIREFVDGPSAHGLLDRLGRLPVGDAARIARDVALALDYLHGRQFIHRDIKPDNILLASSGDAKLTDLGLVKRHGEPHYTTAVQGVGTSYYMPCEQAHDAHAADGRSDIYALGATLYHLLTGQVPFPGNSHAEIMERKERGEFPPASQLNAEVPAALDAILVHALAPRADDRYPTARGLIDDLERCGLVAETPCYTGIDWSQAAPDNPGQPTNLDVPCPTPPTEQMWKEMTNT